MVERLQQTTSTNNRSITKQHRKSLRGFPPTQQQQETTCQNIDQIIVRLQYQNINTRTPKTVNSLSGKKSAMPLIVFKQKHMERRFV